ncbi:hypothetical protein H0H87_002313 [Tephrocybe sp. NHM501043]|nr:hypothetical protein H0H87_002313 [Tephrocybe sp. NHM501043]
MPGDHYYHYPEISHSLEEFIEKATTLDDAGDTEGYIHFVLSGVYADDDYDIDGINDYPTKQAFVDPTQNVVQPDTQLDIMRDYDSLLGITKDFKTLGEVSMFTIPHPTFALRTSVHIEWPITTPAGTRKVQLHKIPNFEFGSFGNRSQLNLFFPGLVGDTDASSNLTRRQRAILYECGIRPTIASLLPYQVSEWPATLEGEEIRAKRVGGGYSWSTKIIPGDVMEHFASEMREHLYINAPEADQSWATGFVVLHTVRGVKHATVHPVDDQSAKNALRDFIYTHNLSDTILESPRNWWIDVGIELSSPTGECLQWRTRYHHELVRQSLSIHHDLAVRTTDTRSAGYSVDPASHLTAIGGCRIVLGPRSSGPSQCIYFQAYTTDKALLYNPQGRHHAKFLTMKDAMGGDGRAAPKAIDELHTAYQHAKLHNASNARAEARVPLIKCFDVFLEFEPLELKLCLCSFPKAVWWGFRIVRLVGISKALTLQNQGSREQRMIRDALGLTAGCVWLTNGLHARPEDGPASRRLMDVCLPLTERDSDPFIHAYKVSHLARIRRRQGSVGHDSDDEENSGWEDDEEEEEDTEGNSASIPYNPYGCIFFRVIFMHDVVPRFRAGGRMINDETIKFLFSMTLAELTAQYVKTGVVPVEVLAGKRMYTNRIPLIPRIIMEDQPEPTLFDIPGDGNHPVILDDSANGSDMEDLPDREPLQDLNSWLSHQWRQFPVDVMMKSPNPKGGTSFSYLRVQTMDRRNATIALFKDATLSRLFTCCAYKIATREEWNRAIDKFFPPKGTEYASNIQNYRHCPYWQAWCKWANNPGTSLATVNSVRGTIRGFFDDVYWLPDAQQDKMWPTSLDPRKHYLTSRGFTRLPLDLRQDQVDPKPAPRLLIHPGGCHPIWEQNE